MIELRNLRHAYHGKSVISIDDFTLEGQSLTALVGPNGCGKSTLLRILALLEIPTGGALRYDGQEVSAEKDRRRLRGRVTLVEQRPYLFRGTVRSNLMYALKLNGVTGDSAASRTGDALERMHIGHLAENPANRLSEGEKQIAAVARALALRPGVLLLDEPTSAADRTAVQRVHEGLEAERQRGATVLFVSHKIEEAFRWSDNVYSMSAGTITAAAPENLFRCNIPGGEGEKRIVRVGPLEVNVITDLTGIRTVAIPAEDIVVSRTHLESSARNEYRGRVVRVSERGPTVVSLMVDAGIDLAVRITKDSLNELDIAVGSEVVLSIKATAIQVF